MRARASAPHGAEPPLQPSVAVPRTSATLPAPAAIAIGVGSTRSAPGIAPAPSWTRK